MVNLGVFPDLMHICDLQICCDAITSTLLELSEPSRALSRDKQLADLLHQCEQWCADNGRSAHCLLTALARRG